MHSPSQIQSLRGFTLIELLVVMTIIGILAGIASVSISGVISSGGLNKATSDLGDVFSQARTFAMRNKTYVYVGLEELSAAQPDTPGVGRVAVVVVASTSGTRPYGNSPCALTASEVASIARPEVFENLHIANATDLTNGNMSSRPAATVDLGGVMNTGNGMSTVTFQWPLSGSPVYNFNKVVIEFSPQGVARLQNQATFNSTLTSYLELPLVPSHGTIFPTGAALAKVNEAALQIDGITGVVQTYRP